MQQITTLRDTGHAAILKSGLASSDVPLPHRGVLYSRTQNENGTYNTRCLDCFLTIAARVETELEHFPFYCRPYLQCLNQAFALSAEAKSFERFCDGLVEGLLVRALAARSSCLSLAPGLFDGVQIGRVGRQVKQLLLPRVRSVCVHRLPCANLSCPSPPHHPV